MLTLAMLEKHWPHADRALLVGMASAAPEVFNKYGLTTPLRMAHFMGQVSEECGAGTEMIESLVYTHAARIRAVWPSRFLSIASAAPYVRQPEKLADKVYDARMGNREGSGDGWNFRGRGPTQITGRDEYEEVGKACGLDLIGTPDLAVAPEHALEVGVADFVKCCGCLPGCDADNIRTVTKRLNGGYEGLDEREHWTAVWKAELI